MLLIKILNTNFLVHSEERECAIHCDAATLWQEKMKTLSKRCFVRVCVHHFHQIALVYGSTMAAH